MKQTGIIFSWKDFLANHNTNKMKCSQGATFIFFFPRLIVGKQTITEKRTVLGSHRNLKRYQGQTYRLGNCSYFKCQKWANKNKFINGLNLKKKQIWKREREKKQQKPKPQTLFWIIWLSQKLKHFHNWDHECRSTMGCNMMYDMFHVLFLRSNSVQNIHKSIATSQLSSSDITPCGVNYPYTSRHPLQGMSYLQCTQSHIDHFSRGQAVLTIITTETAGTEKIKKIIIMKQ